jgi:hypothetical protein
MTRQRKSKKMHQVAKDLGVSQQYPPLVQGQQVRQARDAPGLARDVPCGVDQSASQLGLYCVNQEDGRTTYLPRIK